MFKLVGADPELFLVKNGMISSAIGKIGGTKEFPVPAADLGKGYAYQEDNVLVEYNIPPARTHEELLERNLTMIDFLTTKVKKLDPAYGLLKVPSGEISEEDAQDPRAHVFGCDPDFNVWTMEPNPRPFNPNPLLRSAGGHLHFGIKCTNAQAIRFVRALDIFVGTYSVLHDPDKRRRLLYGKAGSMRRKAYGVEYRVLSNFWVDSAEHCKMIWNLASVAWRTVNGYSDTVIDTYGKDAERAINTSDPALAKAIYSRIV
jgi:hypothetical protein